MSPCRSSLPPPTSKSSSVSLKDTMSSPNMNHQCQGWQTHRYQQSPSQQPDQHYWQHHPQTSPNETPQRYSYYRQHTPAPGSDVQPHYGTSPVPIIAELPAPMPPAPSTTTSEAQLKQDETLAHRMQSLEIDDVRRRLSSVVSQQQRPISMMPLSPQRLTPQPLLHQARSAQSLRQHSQSVGSFNDQRPMSMAPSSTPELALPSLLHQRSAQTLRPHTQSIGSHTDQRSTSMVLPSTKTLTPLPLAHQRSAQSLRPHSRGVGAVTEPWSPSVFNVPPANPDSFSSLPEVVVDSHPVSYHDLKSSSENFPIPVLQDQWPQAQELIKRPSIALESSSLPAYLEQNRQAPYPPQWNLPPILSKYYAHREGKPASGSSWLDTPDSCSWYTIRPSEYAQNPITPSYAFKFKSVSGTFRSPKLLWTMTQSADAPKKATQPTWAYELKLDPKTNMRKSEVLAHGGPKAKDVLTTYVHALNYDSLRFIAPDGRAYMWVSSTTLSSIDGSRFDTLRHAFFVAAGNIPDPLYGHIVADHCFWDGDEEPNEVLYIRSPNVDSALVVATLQVLKDWEKITLRAEKKSNEEAFKKAEEEARRCVLGKRSYWKAGD